jgi:hypothetical protein
MISIRQSDASKPNGSLVEDVAKSGESNIAWLKRVGATSGLLLLGGASVAHFRIRVAQSHARSDLKPSCWSLAGILKSPTSFLACPIELCAEASEIAQNNGVQDCSMRDYDDPDRFPNIAVIRFTQDDKLILKYAKLVASQRGIIDLPTLMLPWLSYVWIAAKSGNPLSEGLGLPSAAFAETVYGIAGIELTPGLASSTSCPEAIWQAAKWWHDHYGDAAEDTQESHAAQHVPTGNFAIRQPVAAADWPRDKKK